MPTETEVLDQIITLLKTGKDEKNVLFHLKKNFKFNKFTDLGLGKFEVFFKKHEDVLYMYKKEAKDSHLTIVESLPIDKEEAIVVEIKEYIKNTPGKPSILNFLKNRFGIIKFTDLGFGSYSEFLRRHQDELKQVKEESSIRDLELKSSLTESDIVNIIKTKGKSRTMDYMRDKYGNTPFSDFGYGKFDEFVKKHNM